MPLRTKACATCRKKRIKCDATLPHCLMCIKTGSQCPGPLDGPLIVDMTTKAKHGMQKRGKKAVEENTRFDTQAMSHHLIILRISQRAVVTEAFYSRLLASFPCEGEEEDIQNKWTWLQYLPRISTDGSSEALTLALQATASAFCAAESTDIALKRYAWDLYGSALAMHGSALRQSQTGKKITIHMISTSVLFSLFEAIQATTADAYRSHVYGAAKMLEITGPGQCHLGVLCQIFFHVRTQMAFVQLASEGAISPVSTKKILYKVLLYEKTPVFQRLMDCIAGLVDIHVSLKTYGVLDHTSLETLEILRAGISSLWKEYHGIAVDTSSTQLGHKPRKLNYNNAFNALIIAYFSSAHILLNMLTPPVTTCQRHDYTVILECATYLQTHEVGCAYMRMAMPLLLVALHAALPWQRIEAMGVFERWKNGSMRGISALALEAVQRRQKAEGDLYTDWSIRHLDHPSLPGKLLVDE